MRLLRAQVPCPNFAKCFPVAQPSAFPEKGHVFDFVGYLFLQFV
jgi:hypothetical protein